MDGMEGHNKNNPSQTFSLLTIANFLTPYGICHLSWILNNNIDTLTGGGRTWTWDRRLKKTWRSASPKPLVLSSFDICVMATVHNDVCQLHIKKQISSIWLLLISHHVICIRSVQTAARIRSLRWAVTVRVRCSRRSKFCVLFEHQRVYLTTNRDN